MATSGAGPHSYPVEINLSELVKSVPISISTIIIGVVILVLNALTLVIVLRGRVLQEAPRNIYLVNLLVSNLVGGVTFSLLGEFFSGYGTPRTCLVFFHLNQWIYISNLFNICCIMADQYVAIEFPFKYHLIMTKRVIYLTIVGVWTLPLVNALVFQFGLRGDTICDTIPGNENIYILALYLLVSLIVIPFPIVIILNLRILMISRRRAIEVSILRVSDISPGRSRPFKKGGTTGHNLVQALHEERATFVQIWRSVLTATIMVESMVLSNAPFSVIVIDVLINKADTIEEQLASSRKLSASFISISINYLASPLIYTLRVPQVKHFYTKLIRDFGRGNNSADVISA